MRDDVADISSDVDLMPADIYHVVNSGAHRRPATLVGAPAVIWSRTFWLPSVSGATAKGATTRRESVEMSNAARLMDKYLIKLINKLDDPKSPTLADEDDAGNILLFSSYYDSKTREIHSQISDKSFSRHEMITFRGVYDGIKIRVRSELHTEYITLCLFIDMWEKPKKDFLRNSLGGRLSAGYEKLNQEISNHYLLTQDVSQDKYDQIISGTRLSLEPTYRFFYGSVWSFLNDALDGIEDEMGTVIADFRGLVLPDKVSDSKESVHTPRRRRVTPSANLLKVPIQRFRSSGRTGGGVNSYLPWNGGKMCFSGSQDNIVSRDVQKSYTPAQSKKIVNFFWPFLSSSKIMKSHEFTCSMLLDCSTVYCSSLGPQGLRGAGSKRPVEYLIVTLSESRWQIGRLIDRLHYLGTMRLAALFDYSKLCYVSNEMKAIGLDIDRDFGREEMKISGKSDAVLALDRRLIQCSNDVEQGGLSFRIERSQYYVSQFKENVGALRIKRIEGFQPYDEFIQRRLFATFDFIRRIGIRYDRLQARLRFLNTEIQTEQMRDAAEQTKKDTNLIREFQNSAEIIAFWFIIPHYLCEMVLEALKEAELCDNKFGYFWRNLQLLIFILAILSWLIIFLSCEVPKYRKKKERCVFEIR